MTSRRLPLGAHCIPRDSLSPDEIQAVIARLTVKPREFPGTAKNEPFAVFVDTPSHICIPRFFALHEIFNNDKVSKEMKNNNDTDKSNDSDDDDDEENSIRQSIKLSSTSSLVSDIVPAEGQIIGEVKMRFQGKLNPMQEEAVQSVKLELETNNGAMLSLFCGGGKTVCALKIASLFQRKTLVVVHTFFLMEQWRERIRQFLPNVRIGIIRGDNIDTNNHDIVIAMLQSLSKRDYPPSIMSEFGLAVFDECHHVCARVLCQALLRIPSRLILGLSATPRRKDGLTRVIPWFVGRLAYVATRDVADMRVQVDRIIFNNNDSLPEQGPQFISAVAQVRARNDVIIRYIFHARRRIGNEKKILVLSDRVAHLEELQRLLSQSKSKTRLSSGLYVGGMARDKLVASSRCDVIFGSYPLAGEGLDIPSLSALILSTPRSDVEQNVGRVLRKSEGGIGAYIVDIVDSSSRLSERRAKDRLRYYLKSGFRITSKQAGDDDDEEEERKEEKGEEEGGSDFEGSSVGDASDDEEYEPGMKGCKQCGEKFSSFFAHECFFDEQRQWMAESSKRKEEDENTISTAPVLGFLKRCRREPSQ